MGISLISGIVIAIIFFLSQVYYFLGTRGKLNEVQGFFPENYKYELLDSESKQIANVNKKNFPELHKLIEELNDYVASTKGTTDFSIIQNKTERELNALSDEATSKISFPTYIGLMGTFAGVFLGLVFFSFGIEAGGTDLPIAQLIHGVLVSMSTSFLGLFLTTWNTSHSAAVFKEEERRKNSFYEFIQNKLMPTLDTSMVVALNKLHETVNLMQPTFSGVLQNFKEAFAESTKAFGSDFKESVDVLKSSVQVMGGNMTLINENIAGQKELIKELQGKEFMKTLKLFIQTGEYFNQLSKNIQNASLYVTQISGATTGLIDAQKSYTSSLKVPSDLITGIENLLNRVKRFEQSMNEIGEKIKKDDIWGAEFSKMIKKHSESISRNSQQIDVYLESSGNKIDKIFQGQERKMEVLSAGYQRSLDTFYEKVDEILKQQEKDLQTRHKEFGRKLEEVFNFEDVHSGFESLNRLNTIEKEITALKAQFESVFKKDDVQNQLINIRKLQDIQETLEKIKSAIEKQNKNSGQSSSVSIQQPIRVQERNDYPYAKTATRVTAEPSQQHTNNQNYDNQSNKSSTKEDENRPNNRGNNTSNYDQEPNGVPIWKKLFPWIKD